MKTIIKYKFIAITTVAVLLLAGARMSQAQDDESRKHLLHQLGGPFFVSRDPVQEDLKLSADQRQKLRDKLSADVQDAAAVEKMNSDEREQAMRVSSPDFLRKTGVLPEGDSHGGATQEVPATKTAI